MIKCIAIAMMMFAMVSNNTTAQKLPGSEEVFDKYLQAMGGKEFLASISDATIEMFTDMQGNQMMMSRKIKSPNKFINVMNGTGMEVYRMTCDGVKVKMVGMQGENVMEGTEAELAVIQGMLIPELQYASLGVTSTVEGIEKVDGKDAYKVANQINGGAVWTDFYDVDSGLKIRSISTMKGPQGDMKQIVSLQNYKDFKGLKYPTKIIQDMGMFKSEFSVEKVKLNTGLKEDQFVIK